MEMEQDQEAARVPEQAAVWDVDVGRAAAADPEAETGRGPDRAVPACVRSADTTRRMPWGHPAMI